MVSFAIEAMTSTSVEDAFCTMVEDHSDFAYNIAFRMLRTREDAEDAVQDAFIYAYRAFSSFKGESKVSTWLYRIVVNSCLMKIRRDKTPSKYLTDTGLDDLTVRDWSAGPEEQAVNNELQENIHESISRLPPEHRAAVVLRDVQGLSNEEAAEVLDVSVSALKSRLRRGRLLLRKHLEAVWQVA